MTKLPHKNHLNFVCLKDIIFEIPRGPTTPSPFLEMLPIASRDSSIHVRLLWSSRAPRLMRMKCDDQMDYGE